MTLCNVGREGVRVCARSPKIRPLRALRMIVLALGGTTATAAIGWLLYPRIRPSSSLQELVYAEASVLQRVRSAGVHVQQRMVGLADGETEINTIIVRRQDQRTDAGPQRVLVMVHGLGGVLGLWSKNLVELAAHFDVIYAFDLLGFGRSSRPVAPAGATARVQAWWVASVEDWREAMQIDQPFEICGHSLGAPLDLVRANGTCLACP